MTPQILDEPTSEAPAFSIIIPHYNTSGLLQRLLDTIPTRDDTEIIVVDDASRQDELKTVRQCCGNRTRQARLLCRDTNGGGGAARNDAMRAARGRWLMFADADDYFERYIKNWSIVVVDKEGMVDRVISDTKANNNPDQDNDTKTDVEMELTIGETYTFYAFANLNELKALVDVDGWKGKTFAELRKTAVELKTLDNYHGGEGTSYIPMSSYGVTKTVSEDMTQNNVSLPLIRLFGKVSIEVTNSTGVDLTVNNLAMGKFRQSGPIYLLPYDAIEKDPDKPNLLLGNEGEDKLMNPVFPSEDVEGTDWIYTPTDEEFIPTSNATDENANKRTYTFYINETNQATVGGNGSDLEIALDVTGEGIEKDNGRKPTNFFFVRRNDWLKIPLTISKADVTVSFEQQHMPIGGLPTQCNFQSGVEVALRTFVTDHAGDITISYSLTKLNGSATEWKLKYYSGSTTSADHYCYAALMSEEDNAQGYLLEPSESEKDQLKWWDVTYGSTTEPKWAYVLHPATEDKNDTTYDETKVSGSFTVTVQELSKASSATIKLNLVAEKDGVEVILPYTLVIKNKQEEGGN